MPSTWFEPIFPFNLIFDLGSYLIFSFIFLILFRLNIINKNLLFVSLLFLLTPFLFNGFLFEWSYLPDQSKYLGEAEIYRKNPKAFIQNIDSYADLKISTTALFYAFSPIISLETYKGISLWNRSLFLFSWIFFAKKKFFDDYNSLLMLLAPSLILFSSVALRENLIILAMIWFLYFFYEKKKLGIFITLTILLLIKYQILFTILLFCLLNFLILEKRFNIKITIILTIIILILFSIFKDQIFEIINFLRRGFFMEEFGSYKSSSASINYQYFKLNYNLKSLILIYEGFKNFLLTPFLKGNFSLFSIIIFLEIIIIFAFLYKRIKVDLNFNLRIAIKWLIILLTSYLFYSLFVFNDGTIYRYKVPILFFVLFGYFTNIKKIKSK